MPTLAWQKSSYSEEGSSCLYVAADPGKALRLRESDDPDVILATTPTALSTLIAAIKNGRLDHLTQS
ncbi:DUF397 domain-containing protein [Streptomyces sp. H27-D2]|uniref:DUF397 domain-containing protein n=1 Tax=Streptomyces sp. H27-D2 TaxID=3046304 RepID=UPI002DBD5F2B|nr:DUF397 domain-containing protein [Streptomyces sp. H27-D2]MEC4015193.1 DUF397 domain-containing protein [Streptomyces sp. H27-D2]